MRTTSIGGLAGRFFTVLFLLSLATAVFADQNSPIHEEKFPQDPVQNRPFRVILAHPILIKDGETLEQLKFESIEQILKSIETRTPYNSVAFSPDGRFLASGSGDNTVKLWDLTKKISSLTFIGGHSGNWLSVDNKNHILRGDDGTLLRIKNGQGDWLPVPPSNLSKQDSFSVSVEKSSSTIGPGETIEFQITVTNDGPNEAYWLNLKPSQSIDASIRLDPPDTEFDRDGKGEQFWKPARIAKLNPGETGILFARISLNLPLPAHSIPPGIRRLPITVVSANGTEMTQEIEVDLRSPVLEWQKAGFDQEFKPLFMDFNHRLESLNFPAFLNPGQNILNANIGNKGNWPLKELRFALLISGGDESDEKSDHSEKIAEQLVKEITAAGTMKLAFVVPDDFDPESNNLVLNGTTSDLPIFAWNLEAPEIERASRWLLWLSATVLILTLSAIFYLRRYRHPLVIQLSKAPDALLDLPPEQLVEAKSRLGQTRRLTAVLSQSEVGSKNLDQAIRFIKKDGAEDKAGWLARRIGGTIAPAPLVPENAKVSVTEPATRTFQIWKLTMPADFPLNLEQCLLCFPEVDVEATDLLNDLKRISQSLLLPILIVAGNAETRREMDEFCEDRGNRLVAPSSRALTRLLIGPEPEKTLAEIFASQLTLTQLSPYQVGGGVNRDTIFFGRRETIAHIMNRDPANYLLVGGRQLGKSSLLKAIERRYREQSGIHCFYLTLSNEILVPRLASALDLPTSSSLDEIASHAAKSQNRFLFLVDEADKFIVHERKHDYPILDACAE